jgi:hypothetical protein
VADPYLTVVAADAAGNGDALTQFADAAASLLHVDVLHLAAMQVIVTTGSGTLARRTQIGFEWVEASQGGEACHTPLEDWWNRTMGWRNDQSEVIVQNQEVTATILGSQTHPMLV